MVDEILANLITKSKSSPKNPFENPQLLRDKKLGEKLIVDTGGIKKSV